MYFCHLPGKDPRSEIKHLYAVTDYTYNGSIQYQCYQDSTYCLCREKQVTTVDFYDDFMPYFGACDSKTNKRAGAYPNCEVYYNQTSSGNYYSIENCGSDNITYASYFRWYSLNEKSYTCYYQNGYDMKDTPECVC